MHREATKRTPSAPSSPRNNRTNKNGNHQHYGRRWSPTSIISSPLATIMMSNANNERSNNSKRRPSTLLESSSDDDYIIQGMSSITQEHKIHPNHVPTRDKRLVIDINDIQHLLTKLLPAKTSTQEERTSLGGSFWGSSSNNNANSNDNNERRQQDHHHQPNLYPENLLLSSKRILDNDDYL
jgi:hypothetical protein